MHTKRSGKYLAFQFVLILAVSLLVAMGARADTVTLASTGTASDSGQFNSMGPTIAIAPNSSWAAALPGSSWVSFGSTGSTTAPGFFTVPNGTVVTFSDVFNVSGTPTGGSISVFADDSAAVYLNGTLLMAEAASTGNTYATCSNTGIGCLLAMTLALPSSDLVDGANTLQFLVAQRNGSSFGLDYAGSVTDTATATPEVGTLALLACGLLFLFGLAFRQRRSPAIAANAQQLA